MPIVRRSAASRRPMARRRGLPAAGLAARDSRSSDVGDAGPAEAAGKSRAWTRPARIGVAAFVAVLAAVTVIGALSPSPVAGGAGASAAASAGTTTLSSRPPSAPPGGPTATDAVAQAPAARTAASVVTTRSACSRPKHRGGRSFSTLPAGPSLPMSTPRSRRPLMRRLAASRVPSRKVRILYPLQYWGSSILLFYPIRFPLQLFQLLPLIRWDSSCSHR